MTTRITIRNDSTDGDVSPHNVEVAEFYELTQLFGSKSVLIPGESMERVVWDGLVLFVKEVPN